jgi:hypothetical protein
LAAVASAKAGGSGGRFVFRFNLSFKARCALRLGEGPRALGFSILVVAYLLNLDGWHKRRYNNYLTGALVFLG